MKWALSLVLVAASVLVRPTAATAIDPTVGARIGGSLGSPIPFGNIPEGASGSPIVGLVAGGYVDWGLSSTWTVVSEVQFVHYGASFSTPLQDHPIVERIPVQAPDGSTAIYEVETVFTGTANGEFSNNYIQLPVYAAWSPLPKWRFTGGLYLGWLVSTSSYATGTGTVGIRPEVVEKDMYFDEKLRGIDYGMQLGTQFFAFEDLFVDLRGVLGLTSIFDEEYKTVDRTVQNAYVHITLGYRIF